MNIQQNVGAAGLHQKNNEHTSCSGKKQRCSNAFSATLQRDLLLAWRARADILISLGFLVVVASLFPLGMGAEPRQLAAIGPGVIWVAALLSCLLSLGRLFAQDHADGVLEQLLLSGEPPTLWVSAKLLAFWLSACLPIVLLSPLLALWFQLPVDVLPVLTVSLLLGTPALAMLGAIGTALTLGLNNGMLLGLLVLPLYVPVLIFGTAATATAMLGMDASSHLLLLGGMCAACMALAPWTCSACLNIATE